MILKIIGAYEILEEISGNERGMVFRAFDPSLNKEIALKLIQSPSLFTLTSQRKFTQQMAALQALQHPSLLSIIAFGDENNRPFIVTPLMDGNLTHRFASGPLPVIKMLDWFQLIASALDFAAANGQIHSDIKPNNILFDQHGHPFVGDLGIAEVINSLSSAKIPVVNPYYTSPEQVRKRSLTSASQVYSLAALIYHALTGQVLFQGASEMVSSFKHTSETPRSIRVLRPDLPEAFNEVMKKALEKDPADRYPSAVQFVRELVRANGGVMTPEEVPPEVHRQPVQTPRTTTALPGQFGMPVPANPNAARRMILAVGVMFMLVCCGAAIAILLGAN